MDEQFACFVEVIQNININVPLLDARPTYAHYLKDILNNKRPMLTTEVIKFTRSVVPACSNCFHKTKTRGAPQRHTQLGHVTSTMTDATLIQEHHAQGGLGSTELHNTMHLQSTNLLVH